MENHVIKLQVRWSDIDANRHLRHSVYYDYGAMCRMEMLRSLGLSTTKLEELQIGPVLFREEAIFKREILFEDHITISTHLLKATEDYGRWSIGHQLVKDGGVVAATLQVDGAWIDLQKRKLAVPDEFVRDIFSRIPKSQQFEFILKKS